MVTCKDCFHCRACHEMYLVAVSSEDDFFERHDAETCEDFINKADVVEVKHGKWIEENPQKSEYCRIVKCSVCGHGYIVSNDIDLAIWSKRRNFCTDCGADMRGEKKEDV